MRKLTFFAILFFAYNFSNAQSFKNSLEVIPIVQKTDQLQTVEEFEKTVPVFDMTGRQKNYVHYTFVVDTTTKKLVKVNVEDHSAKISQSYYFYNECLVMCRYHNEGSDRDEFMVLLNMNYSLNPESANLQSAVAIKSQLKIAEGYKLLLFFKDGKYL